METVEKEVRLTKEDIQDLRANLKIVYIFLIITLIAFVLVFQVAKADDIFRIFLVVFVALVCGLIFYVYRGFFLTLSSGYKTVVRGLVTDLEILYDKADKRSGRPANFIHIGEKKISVLEEHYQKVKVGDLIELHYTPRTGLSLKVEILGDAHKKDFHFPM